VDWRSEFTRDGQTNDTEETAGRLAAMIGAIDPDVLALQDGPSRSAELALFVHDHLADGSELFLGDSGGAQKARPALEAGSVESSPRESVFTGLAESSVAGHVDTASLTPCLRDVSRCSPRMRWRHCRNSRSGHPSRRSPSSLRATCR
jgi:hypothetical protein